MISVCRDKRICGQPQAPSTGGRRPPSAELTCSPASGRAVGRGNARARRPLLLSRRKLRPGVAGRGPLSRTGASAEAMNLGPMAVARAGPPMWKAVVGELLGFRLRLGRFKSLGNCHKPSCRGAPLPTFTGEGVFLRDVSDHDKHRISSHPHGVPIPNAPLRRQTWPTSLTRRP